MILKRGDYVPKGVKSNKGTTDDINNAKDFARRILIHLGLSPGTCDEVLYATGDHRNPGDCIHLGGLWKPEDLTRDGLKSLALGPAETSGLEDEEKEGGQRAKAKGTGKGPQRNVKPKAKKKKN